ncbi:hypothetical protein SKAU_G00126880 [Synaphobranchus kaupii]|uniref:DUF4795 domain-containing protein n=1 Tax=Synaphobranchus kaupii TaxID=118154 RepID=A0A9Q1J0T8_SYNKA|nr:hypothetical protein SKAU_G00126880 [Synaphobranchus kaupii]
MDALDQLPTADVLLKQTTSGSAQLVSDMWQLMQLRKKTEANQDGITKAMSVLGDMLDEVRTLKDTRNSTLMQMEELQVNLQAVKDAMKALEDIKERMRQMEEALRLLGCNLAALPHPEELVLWSHVTEALPQPSGPQNQPDTESQQQAGRQALQRVGALSAGQAALKEELESLQEQLQQHTLSLVEEASLKILGCSSLQADGMTTAKCIGSKCPSCPTVCDEQRGLATVWDKLAEFRAESDRQNVATQQLLGSCREMESRVSHLEQHRDHMHRRKRSGESGEVQLERGVGDEDASLSQAQQKAISQYLSSMLEDLLPTLPPQDWDWPEVLDKLSKDMERKLDRVELIPLKQELEEGWRKIRARLKQEPDLNADTPAGFRKKLLERVSCISCDKPANILTGMHLVTVQSRPPRPGSCGPMGSQQRRWAWGLPLHSRGIQTRRATAGRRPPSAQTLGTFYPCMDPVQQPYCREEVGILGTDGILYRGRVDLTLPSLVPPCSRASTPILAERIDEEVAAVAVVLSLGSVTFASVIFMRRHVRWSGRVMAKLGPAAD